MVLKEVAEILSVTIEHVTTEKTQKIKMPERSHASLKQIEN